MDRRKFISTAGIGAVAASTALATPAISQGRKQIRMVTTWPKNFPGLGVAAQRIADRIGILTEGRLTVQVFGGGELVKPFDSFDAVASGKVEMYHAADYYWASKHPAFSFFTAVPLGMTAHELEAWVHYGGGQQLWDELSGGFGVKALLAGNTGVQMGGWYQNPVRTMGDIKNLKMRIPGLGGEVIKRLGGSAISVPGGEIISAIQSGKLNAAEWIGPYNDQTFGLHNVFKNYMFPGFHEPGTGASLGMNKAFWDGLSPLEKEIISTVCSSTNDLLMAEFNARNGQALAELTENHGVKLHIFPKDVWGQIAKMSKEVVNEIGLRDELGERILQSWTNFQKRVSNWQQISDISYTAFRSIVMRY